MDRKVMRLFRGLGRYHHVSKKNPDRNIAVVILEIVEDKWYEFFLHNQRGLLVEWVLLARGNERIFTVSAPWYIGARF
jgi:hypothetical protein